VRILFLPLLAAVAVSLAAQQPAIPATIVPGNLSIPAELDTTLRADKAHVGDVVKFKTIEAVLVAKGVIMPANTKLYGRVLGASPRQEQKPSWISVVIDRAEWKQHSLALRAFISGQVFPSANTFSQRPEEEAPNPVPGTPTSIPTSNSKKYNLSDPRGAIAMAHANESANWGHETSMPRATLEGVKLARQKSGITLLFSEKHNLKLSSGIVFMLQNMPAPAAVPDKTTVSAVTK